MTRNDLINVARYCALESDCGRCPLEARANCSGELLLAMSDMLDVDRELLAGIINTKEETTVKTIDNVLCGEITLYGQFENRIKVYTSGKMLVIYMNNQFVSRCDTPEEVDAEIEALRCEHGLSFIRPVAGQEAGTC